MRVGRETRVRRYSIFVEHAQAAEALISRVPVVGEGEGVVCVEPAMVSVAALAGATRNDLGVTESFRHGFDGVACGHRRFRSGNCLYRCGGGCCCFV